MLRFPSLAARFGAERLLVVGALFIAGRSILAASANQPAVLLAASVLGGIGFAFFLVGGVTYVSEHVPSRLAATAQGIFQGVGNSMGQVVASAAGGSVAAFAGISGLFVIAAGFGIVATSIIAIAVLRADASGGGAPPAGPPGRPATRAGPDPPIAPRRPRAPQPVR